MIGLGIWECDIDTVFWEGIARMRIFDNNGAYGFEFVVPGEKTVDIRVCDVEEDGPCSLNAHATANILHGREASVRVEFEGDTFTGWIKVPFIGKIKFERGRRVEKL